MAVSAAGEFEDDLAVPIASVASRLSDALRLD